MALSANALVARLLLRRGLVPVARADPGPTATCIPFAVRHVPGETTTNFCARKIHNGKVLTLRGTTTASGPLVHPRSKATILQFESSVSFIYSDEVLVTVSSRATSLRRQSKLLSARTIVEYGRSIPGTPRAVLNIVDGKLTGTVASQQVRPRAFDVARVNPRANERLELSVGRAVLPPRFEPGLGGAMRDLVALANENIKRGPRPLTVGSDTRNLMHSKPNVFRRVGFVAGAGAAPGMQGPGSSEACGNCVNNCEEVTASCVAVAAGTCVLDFGISCAAIPVCYTGDAICHDGCNSPGGACCPQTCPGNDLCCESGPLLCDCGCCYSDQSVCTNNGCCPKDTPVGCPAGDYVRCCPNKTDCCGAECCPPGSHCGDPTQDLCCPDGEDACGSTCCPTGNCQPGNICCPPRQPICNNVPGQGLPGKVCCQGGACDNNGNCCPPQVTFVKAAIFVARLSTSAAKVSVAGWTPSAYRTETAR
jgi:hypothetical protein